MTTALTFPNAEQFKSKTVLLVETARGIEITDDDGFAEVGQFIMSIKTDQKELDRLCDGAIEAAHLEHKSRVALKKEYAIPLKEAEDIAKAKMAAWDKKRKDEIAAQQKKLEDEARAVAEEKRRVEAEKVEAANKIRREKEAAEQKVRDEAIAKAKKEGDAKAAAALAEQQKRAKEMAAIKANEDALKAEKAAAAPLKVAPVAKIEAPKAAGMTFTEAWDGKVDDLMTLCLAVVAKKAPLTLLKANDTEIRKFAESTAGKIEVPGITWYTKDRVGARS